MKTQLNTLLAAAGIIVLLSTTAQALANVQVQTVDVSPSVIEPGQEFELELGIKNIGDTGASKVRVVLEEKEGFRVLTEKIKEYSGLSAESTIHPFFTLRANNNITSGNYSIKIRAGEVKDAVFSSREYEAYFLVKGKPILVIQETSTNPDPLCCSAEGLVCMNIKNVGTGASDQTLVKVNSSPTGPFVVKEYEKYVGTIRVDEEKDVCVQLWTKAATSAGVYNVPVRFSYKNQLGEQVNQDTQVGLRVTSRSNFTISRVETQKTGAKLEITADLVNMGPSDARYVTVTPIQKTGILEISPKDIYFGKIETDDYETLDFEILPDPAYTESQHTIVFQVSYGNDYNEKFSSTQSLSFETMQQTGEQKDSGFLGYLLLLTLAAFIAVAYVVGKKRCKPK